jgi:hypothetical protein
MLTGWEVESGSFEFFSSDLLAILGSRIGSARLANLIKNIETTATSRRAMSLEPLITDPVSPLTTFLREEVPHAKRGIYIQRKSGISLKQPRDSRLLGYFDQIHPLYPFLDRVAFENSANSTELEQRITVDHAWAATFFSVLSLGMCYHEAGTFAPLQGPSWTVFRRAMRLFPLLTIARPSLGVLQVGANSSSSGSS